MKRFTILALLLSSPMTFAEPTADSGAAAPPSSASAKAAETLVSHDLVKPLVAKEANRSKFSRGAMPPDERRVRILDEQPRKDADGNGFVRFAIDARHGFVTEDTPWRKDAITGCVYLDRREVFVRKGEEYRPAAFLLGKKVKPAAEATCQSAEAQVAHAN